jgi:hypothetical protein
LTPQQNCQKILQVIDAALNILALEEEEEDGDDDVRSDHAKSNGERRRD